MGLYFRVRAVQRPRRAQQGVGGLFSDGKINEQTLSFYRHRRYRDGGVGHSSFEKRISGLRLRSARESDGTEFKGAGRACHDRSRERKYQRRGLRGLLLGGRAG